MLLVKVRAPIHVQIQVRHSPLSLHLNFAPTTNLNAVRTAATEDTDLPDPLEGSVPLSRRLASGDNGAIGGAPTAIPTPSQGRQSTNRHDSIQETNATASRAADPAADSQKDGESDSSQADFASKNSKTKMRGGAAAESANSFPAFFDNASGGVSSNITRQPSPAAMQQHQANGVGAAGAAGSINMLNGLPQAGQQMDINILYNLVLQLSEELSNNRNHVSSLIDAVQRLQVGYTQ